MKKKVGIFVSHPIQYFAPLFKYIEENSHILDITIYYFSDFSVQGHEEKDFGGSFKWDIDLLNGYKYVFLRNAQNIHSVDGFFSCANYDIFNIIKKERFDLVINFGWMHLSNFFVYLACIKNSTPFAIRGETPLIYEKDKKGLKATVRKVLLSYIFSKASACFFIGSQNKDFYKAFGVGDDRLFFTPYSVDNDRFINATRHVDILSIKKRFAISDNKKIILFSGKLIDRKRPILLLNAFVDFAKMAHLVFVGSGPLENELKSIAKQNGILDSVTFAGFVNQTEIVDYYAIADVFVLPSVHETWGLVVNEAMCASNAIIVSTLVGSGYDLVDGNGIVFEADNSNALTDAISAVLDESSTAKMQQRSKEIILKWGFNEIMIGFEEFFKRGNVEI